MRYIVSITKVNYPRTTAARTFDFSDGAQPWIELTDFVTDTIEGQEYGQD